MENDKGKIVRLEFKWFTQEQLQDAKFLPTILKSQINNNTLTNIITND
jgi:hypothetical protein